MLGTEPGRGAEVWRARSGVVPQSWRDHSRGRVRELVAHLGRYYEPYGVPGQERPRPVDDLLETVGLTLLGVCLLGLLAPVLPRRMARCESGADLQERRDEALQRYA